ncbi:aminotransferase class III-fold pyridoxal phosphate-dependent enzyme [Pelagibacterium sp.]|uniref:aminotransferase class III-fold pyridoxal phosphate-dependent enzyme n=1 Tax=Pelagibacterium sp. TaxID=1967288 RepID=UPI003A8F806F
MTSFDLPPPNLSEPEIQALLIAHYGISGQVTMLASERDQNARVDTSTGSFVLKIAHCAEDENFLDLQNSALSHLEAVGLDGIPRVIPTLAGRAMALAEWGGHVSWVRLLSYVDGQLLSGSSRTLAQLEALGRYLGNVSKGLSSFGHPGAHRQGFMWSLDEAGACERFAEDIADNAHRAMVVGLFAHYRLHVAPRVWSLRKSVLHQDANDNNVVVDAKGGIVGLIDFGDMCFGSQINELAIAMAYGVLDAPDPLAAIRTIVAGYAAEFAITEDEAELVFDLMRMRLVMSVCISSHQHKRFPENDYLLISQAPAFSLLERLDRLDPSMVQAVCRKAAGFDATRNFRAVVSHLKTTRISALVRPDLRDRPRLLVGCHGAAGQAADPNFDGLPAWLEELRSEESELFAIRPHSETRIADGANADIEPSPPLGMDLYLPAGTQLYSPLSGTVHCCTDGDDKDDDFTVVLRHQTPLGVPFYSVFSNLGTLAPSLEIGKLVQAGDPIGFTGALKRQDGRARHLRLQVRTDHPACARAIDQGQLAAKDVWSQISPDPNLLLRLAPETFEVDPHPPEAVLAKRSERIGPSLSVSYQRKLKIVRGEGAYLFDHTGRRYLDCVNNITHVGHCNPRVVEAQCRQAERLNTNSRYLHDLMPRLADRLVSHLPSPLSVVYFTNSGTEANELALRIARTALNQKDTIVLDWAYHGNSGGMVEISPYKFKRKGGHGQPDFVQIAEFPDPYRGRIKAHGRQAGRDYAQDITRCLNAIKARTGQRSATFIAESVSGVGGQVFLPQAYLQTVYELIRADGGIVIADEVQCGFGRLGNAFWGFELQGVVPDIVVLGKPIGNGHPIGAVVTTPELAGKFANGMEYFNSFGGNPVSMAVGLAVLDEIEARNLQSEALATGSHLLAAFKELKERFALIGDVRGSGLFLGIELVRERQTLEPATSEASAIVNHMRDNGVLISTDGPHDNVLKIKPPMVFARAEADRLVSALGAAFAAIGQAS